MFHRATKVIILSQLVALIAGTPQLVIAQDTHISYFPEVVVTEEQGKKLLTIEEQATAVLEKLGVDIFRI